MKTLSISHFIKCWFLGSFVGSCTQELFCHGQMRTRISLWKFLTCQPQIPSEIQEGKAAWTAHGQELISC